jgi:phospholipase C
MVQLDRRRFLQLAGGAAAAAMSSGFAETIARAASVPARRSRGTIEDVEHVVVLMQENRSFDHYLASMRGVRGFGDPHPAVLPSGRSVWHQPIESGSSEVLLPFHPTVDDLGAAFLTGLPHAWPDGHAAFNVGHYDGWVPAKGTATMAHLVREDALFHYALADAFTICDAYYCSFIGNTDPNRYYMWTGWTGNDGNGGGPVLYNDELGYDWMTYPERLEAAGVSWKVYQDSGSGLDADGFWGWDDDPYIGNYGDNSLLYFNNYRNSEPGDALYERARIGTHANAGQDYFEILAADVAAGQLPAVSYIPAPEAFSEHSNWPTNYGAWYISRVLDVLTSNPDVWSRTVLFVTYDENDGFFDHVVPPHPHTPLIPGDSTVPTDFEFMPGNPRAAAGHYGFGPRVPMFVVSPWSTGGWVCSETFDHTSIIRFVERRFGVIEPQITPWRRAVAGDLTSSLDFGRRVTSVPPLPSTDGYEPRDRERHDTFVPDVPAVGALPAQEPGTRPARAIGYDLTVEEHRASDSISVEFMNAGELGAQFQARSLAPAGAPHSYTVGAHQSLRASWPVSGDYDIHVHGPNGFFRRFAGAIALDRVHVTLRRIDSSDVLQIVVDAPRGTAVQVVDAYAGPIDVDRGGIGILRTGDSAGWYDVSVSTPGTTWQRVFAGHLDVGRASFSDPAFGRSNAPASVS